MCCWHIFNIVYLLKVLKGIYTYIYIYIYIYILRTYVCMCVMIYKIIYVFFLSKMNHKQDHMTKITYELPLQLLHTKLQNDSFKHV